MDNDNPTALPQSQPTVTPTPQVADPGGDKSDKKMALWLIGGLVVIVLVVGGIYWYLGGQTTTPYNQQTQNTSNSVVQGQDNLEEEIVSIEVEDEDAEFAAVDKDLSNL